jgi:hypothetical protein
VKLNIIRFLSNLIRNDTGVSSKSAALVVITIISVLLLIIVGVILIVEISYNHTISTDLNGLAAFVGSIAGLLVSVGLPKAMSERFNRNGHTRKHKHCDDLDYDNK